MKPTSYDDALKVMHDRAIPVSEAKEILLEKSALSVDERQKHRRKRHFLPKAAEMCTPCTILGPASNATASWWQEGKVIKCLFYKDPRKKNGFSDQDNIIRAVGNTILEDMHCR